MRKFIAIGVLIGGLLAGAGTGTATAQGQGGNADPLSLAASGVLIPFILGGSGGLVAVVEVSSPVGPNPDLHLVFFNTTCDRISSISLPETTNDIGFVDVGVTLATFPPTPPPSGLVAIANTGFGNELIPLQNPIHSRVYEFATVDGRSRIFEPIILDSYEFPGNPHTWSPLRTGATFYAPLEVPGSVTTVLTLICPRATIQNGTTTNLGIFPIGVGVPTPVIISGESFPAISPAFNSGTTNMSGRVYDTDEFFLRDVNFTCDCLTEISITSFIGGAIYLSTSDPRPGGGPGASLGTYTELEVTSPQPAGNDRGSFTGYRSVSTVGSAFNNFFGRLSNGSRAALRNSGSGNR